MCRKKMLSTFLRVETICPICLTPFFSPMTILNVDDDVEDIEIFCDAVREIDRSIICLVAKSAEEAYQILNSEIELPQFIFLDINMPKLSGINFYKSLGISLFFFD